MTQPEMTSASVASLIAQTLSEHLEATGQVEVTAPQEGTRLLGMTFADGTYFEVAVTQTAKPVASPLAGQR